MIARTSAVVEAGGRLAAVTCAPPLTLRQVRGDDRDECALCLVGTAAGPLAGDELVLDLAVRRDARATLQATGAGIAQGGGGARSLRVHARLDPGARLVAHPAPVVAGAGSRLGLAVSLDLAADATIEWHEMLVLGRTGEAAGALTVSWQVTVGARPVLRSFIDLADPWLAKWPGMLGGSRVIATAFVHDPARKQRTVVLSPTAVLARLGEHAALATVLGSDAAEVRATMRALLATVP